MFLAQASALLDHLAGWLDRSRPAEEVARTVAQGLEFLCTTTDGPVLAVRAEEIGADRIAFRLTPAAAPLKGLPDTVLEIPLR
jgi:hypothetical protein